MRDIVRKEGDMDSRNVIIGERIRYFRTQKKMSQEDLGFEVNLNRAHISNIENGRYSLTLDSLIDIANSLDVSVDDILGDAVEKSASTFISEPDHLLLDCSEEEASILISNMKSLKTKLREYIIKK